MSRMLSGLRYLRSGMGFGNGQRETSRENSQVQLWVNEKVTIQHFVYDGINALIGSLTTLLRAQRRPPFGSAFLLNNVSYLVSHLVLRPTNPNTPSLLSKPTTDFLTSPWRTAKAGNFDASFSPLMQELADNTRDKTSSSRWKAVAKEKFPSPCLKRLENDIGWQKRWKRIQRSAVGEEVVKALADPQKRKSSCIFARICFL